MVSIVMAYFERKSLLIKTLQSIEKSSIKDIEVIVVDDYSCEAERIEDLQSIYSFLKVIRVSKEEKWYECSCVAYNRGIAAIKGDIVIIQNPECLHIGDVLKYVVENITDDNYLSISAYSIHKLWLGNLEKYVSGFKELPQRKAVNDFGWRNHPVYHPVYLHFCSALTRKNMDILQGFDERYAMGIAYDDNELVERVTRLGLKKEIPTEVSVIHQGHDKKIYANYSDKIKKNKTFFELLTCKESVIGVKNSFKNPGI